MTFDELLAPHDAHVRELAHRARALLHELLPDAHETVHPGWRNVVFGRSTAMRDMLFVLSPHRGRVNIGLAGAGLPDPDGLLEGVGARARHVKIASIAALERPALRALLAVAASSAVAINAAPSQAGAERPRPPAGFKIDRARTIAAPAARVWAAWSDASVRGRWLGVEHPIAVRTATPPKSLRATWADGSSIAVQLAAAPGVGERTVVRVEHSKLATSEDADAMRTFWSERLDRLRVEVTGA